METRALTREEARQLINGARNNRDTLIIVLALNTGLRVSELLSLKFEDVITLIKDYRDNTIVKIVIRDSLTVLKENTKGKRRPRSIKINSSVKDQLKAYASEIFTRNPTLKLSNPLFFGRKNGGKTALKRQTVYQIIKDIADKTDMDSRGVSPHTLRRTFATWLYMKTKDIVKVSAILGHQSIVTTQLYIKYALLIFDDDVELLDFGID